MFDFLHVTPKKLMYLFRTLIDYYKRKNESSLLGGETSNIFDVLPRNLGKMNPCWRAYFSDGFESPPTRLRCLWKMLLQIDWHMFFWINELIISKSGMLRETLQCRNCGCHMLTICCVVLFCSWLCYMSFLQQVSAILTTWLRWSVACKHATGCDAGSHGGAWSVSWCWRISNSPGWERSGRKKSGCKIKL